jgi:hypothetical protein
MCEETLRERAKGRRFVRGNAKVFESTLAKLTQGKAR